MTDASSAGLQPKDDRNSVPSTKVADEPRGIRQAPLRPQRGDPASSRKTVGKSSFRLLDSSLNSEIFSFLSPSLEMERQLRDLNPRAEAFRQLGTNSPSETCQNRIETRRPASPHQGREIVPEETGTAIETEIATVTGIVTTDRVAVEIKTTTTTSVAARTMVRDAVASRNPNH